MMALRIDLAAAAIGAPAGAAFSGSAPPEMS